MDRPRHTETIMRTVDRGSGRRAIVAVLGLAVTAAPARAQVAAVTDMKDDIAAIIVHNPSARTMTVEVALHHGSVQDEKLVLGAVVNAIVGPASFQLAPGSTQTVRAMLREPVEPGTVLRIVTTLTPVFEQQDGDERPRGQIVLATRLITKLLVH